MNLNTRKCTIKATKYLTFNSLPGFTNVLAVEDLITTLFLFNRRSVEMIILYLEFCEVSNELLKKRDLSRAEYSLFTFETV